MTNFHLAIVMLGLLGSTPVLAQQKAASAPLVTPVALPGTKPLAKTAEPVEPITCTMLTGEVLDENGHPLVGASVAVVGTHELNSTNADGLYHFTVPPQARQMTKLRVSAAGYTPLDVEVTHCTQPAITLQPLPGTRIKHNKKHYGKIMDIGDESGIRRKE